MALKINEELMTRVDPMAFTPNMRDTETNPYSPDEARVAKFLVELSGGNVGAGDDPIGFLMSSYAYMSHQRGKVREAIKTAQSDNRLSGLPKSIMLEDFLECL